jgi:ABC-type enterochelin transport system permease subunit
MLLVLIFVCLFGLILGVIQAAMDPENHKCRFAIMFNVAKEISRSEPIGIALGMMMGLSLELLR